MIVGWRVNGSQVVLRVRDTDFGIDREYLRYLLDRFYLVDRGRSCVPSKGSICAILLTPLELTKS